MPVTHCKDGEFTPKMFKDGKAVITIRGKSKPLTKVEQQGQVTLSAICEAGLLRAVRSMDKPAIDTPID